MRRIGLVLLLAVPLTMVAQKELSAPEMIAPSDADARVKQYNEPNLIARPIKMTDAPLVLFLAGTHGKPQYLPVLKTVVAQGFVAISLAYNDDTNGLAVCQLVSDPQCAEHFREMRIYGTGLSKEVSNPVAESIVARLSALLRLLDKRNPNERWNRYLEADGQPKWSQIIVSGLSQGAGMAAYIAKQHEVPRVVLFSSPVDLARGQRYASAPWLAWPSKTPPERWYAGRNSREVFNDGLIKAYPILKIPADHIRVFSLDLPPVRNPNAKNPYHGINIRDTRYEEDWRFLSGSAADYK